MAMTFNSMERLEPPFRSVAELGSVIPVGGGIVVANREWKLLFYLQADCVQEIEGWGEFPTKTGDVLILPRVCRQRYRLNAGSGAPARVHVTKITLSLPPLDPGEKRPPEADNDPERDLSSFIRHYFSETRHLAAGQTAPMQEILVAIRREMEEHRPGIRHRIRGLSTNLLVHLARKLYE